MKPKDERGEPVFSGPTVDKILTETIIEHAADHAQAGSETKPQKQESVSEKPGCCKRSMDKKSVVKIMLLALMGMITVACFLLVGSFYFVKKDTKKKKR